MQNLQWRSKAKVVAWVHMVMVALHLTLIIVATALIIFGEHVTKKEMKKNQVYPAYKFKETPAPVSGFVILLWIMVGVTVISAVIEICGCIMLLKATKTSTEAGDCYRKCRIYIIITSVILILQIIVTLLSKDTTSFSSGIVSVILRALFVFVAYKFMKEVEPYSRNSTHD